MTELPTGTVTFAFTDIEGSTRLLTALGADYPGVLARHNALVREEIARAGGREVKTEGDAFFVVFRTAPAALNWAAAVQRALAHEPWPAGGEVRVRVGLHTGEGVLSEGDYVGIDVHRAARVAAAAHGGQVIISETTRALAADALPAGTTLSDLGEHRLKDLPAPMHLHQVTIDGLPSDFPPLRSIGKGSLPETLTSLVGREREIGEVGQLLEQARLVTLTGPGGTGKTRLSIEVARAVGERFADGAWFVALDSLRDPELVLPAIARTLAVREEANRTPAESLAQALGERRLLLVLDNLEQVVAAAPRIGALLRDAPGPRVLCSSREVLRISGEQEYAVPPLELDRAVQLFIERARQVRPDFVPAGDDLAAIREICRALDRLPLAIELAAVRVRLFSPRALAQRLGDRLATFQSTARDLPERQRTLRGAIEWSYDLLEPVEREVFARLSVFAAGAELTAIEAIIDPAGDVTDDVLGSLGSLVEKSLIRAEDGPLGEARFAMLETIRDYAAERLVASPDMDGVHNRHLDWFVLLAEQLEPELTGPRSEVALARLAAEHDNVRSAIEWSISAGRPSSGLRVAGGLWRFWQLGGNLGEGRALLERLLALPLSADDGAARARGLTGYGGIVYWQGQYAAARQAYEEALALYQSVGDESRVAAGMFDLAFPIAIAGELDEARRLFAESSAIYHRLGDERGWLMVGEGTSVLALMAHDLPRAREIADGLVGEYRRLGMKFRLSDTLGLLTAIHLQLGDAVGARLRLEESVAEWRAIGDVSARARALEFGASLALAEGRLLDGARLVGALQAMRDLGEPFLTPGEVIGLPNPAEDLRSRLGDETFTAAFEEGRSWPPDEALDRAAGSPAGPRERSD